MLYSKSNNKVVADFPIGSAQCKFASNGSINTYGFKSFVSKDQIYFPGDNPMLVCEHKSYYDRGDSEHPAGLQTINQGVIASLGSTGFGDSYGLRNDIYTYLDNAFIFQYGLNRITNWVDYADWHRSPSSNCYTTETADALWLTAPVVQEYYEESGGIIETLTSQVINPILFEECDRFELDSYDRGLNLTGTPNEYVSGRLSAYHPGGSVFTAIYSASTKNFVPLSQRLGGLPFPNYTPTRAYRYSGTRFRYKYNDIDVGYKFYGSSGLTAAAYIYPLIQNNLHYNISDYISTNLRLYEYSTTGEGVTGVIYNPANGKLDNNITADIQYHKYVNLPRLQEEDSYDPTDYTWQPVTGTQGTVGGGGGYNCSFSIYSVYKNKSNKHPYNINVTSYDSESYFDVQNDNLIPACYGGVMIFSGNSLDSHFNVNEHKFLCIGMKGVSPTAISSYSGTPANNLECKLYKFNSDHFKRIYPNTYCFWDNELCNYYNTLNNSDYGLDLNTYTPIGPFFFKVSAETFITDKNQKIVTFELNDDDYLEVPHLLNTINYISTVKPEPNENSKFLITKPASSIWYYSQYGYEVCRGNTNECSYLAIQRPLEYTVNYLSFEPTITEITNIGKSMSAVIEFRKSRGQNLTALSAIKSDWRYCTNISSMASLFKGATVLKEIPSSWSGLSNVQYTTEMFAGCTALSDIPNDLFTYATKLTAGSFSAMFSGCVSITSDIAPILDWITNPDNIFPVPLYYQDMFKGCTGVHSGTNDYNTITADTSKATYYNSIFGLT